MEKKITKRERFMELRTLAVEVGNTDLVDFIDKEIALLDKKKNVDRKPTATQKANEEYKAMVLAFLATKDCPQSINEIKAGIPVFGEKDFSNQKISRLLNDLYHQGLPDRKVDKFTVDKLVCFQLKAE